MCKFTKMLLSVMLILLISNFTFLTNNGVIMEKNVQAAINNKFQQTIKDDGGAVVIPTCSHTYGWSTSKAATCTTAGENVYKCTKCGYVKSRYTVVPTGHPGYSPLTCTQDSVCIRCGYVIQKASGHNYTKATCSEAQKCTRCNVKVGGPLGHSYGAATCTSPKTCIRCGVTMGEKLGHNFTVATCQTPKKCTRCGITEGTTVAHNYIGATCTNGGTCIRCGEKSEKGLGHAYTKPTCTNAGRCVRCGDVSEPAIGHKYSKATCTTPAKCTRCSATKGKELGHLFNKATCNLPSTCTRCGKQSGKSLGHTYTKATCTAPETCINCGSTRGKKLEHDYEGGTCTTAGRCINCGKMEEKLSEHNFTKATCTEPAKCKYCDLVIEKALGHDFKPATCTQPQMCKNCRMTVGKANGHDIVEATCNTPKKCKNCRLVLSKALGHTYTDATCKTPKTCVTCGKTSGRPLKHDYIKATCTAPKTCKNCGATVGKALEHDFKVKETNEKEHILSCQNCSYTKTEAHTPGEKCDCGFEAAKLEKCTPKKMVQSHNIEERYGKVYKTNHEVYLYCNDCDINSKQPNEPHKFDNNGKCLCGKEKCTETKIAETHKNIKKSTTKLKTSDAEYSIKHLISITCQECNVTVKEKVAHEFDEKGKCKCGYSDTSKAKCTYNVTVKTHNIEKTNLKSVDKNYHSYTPNCKDCNIISKEIKEKHVFDTKGKCACDYYDINRASCTPEEMITGHKTSEKYDKTKTTIDKHVKTITCTKCKVSKMVVEPHNFNQNGQCDCTYKDVSKAKCTVTGMVKGHFPEKVDIRDEKTTYTPLHTYKLYCKICDVKSESMTERHTPNSEGVCICGYVDFTKVEKGYTVKKKNKVSYAERIDPDSKVILLGFGGDGEDEWELRQGGQNFVVNDPRVTDSCNYAYVTKPEEGWRKNRERVVNTSVDYILKATGCSSLEEVKEQGYEVVLYAYSSGGEMLDPVWDELHANGLTPTAEMMVESYVRDRVKDEQITQHAAAGTNVHIYSVTNGAKDSISDRTNQAGERLNGTGTNGTIEHTQYIPEDGSKNPYYTHGQAGKQSADSVVEVLESLENDN